MANFKRLSATLILAFVFLAVIPFAGASPRLQGIPASYEITAENDTFQLYFDPATLAFKLLDKRSQFLWHSGLDEPLEGDRLNTSWRAFAQGGLSIEFYDNRGVNRRVSIPNTEHSIEVTPIDQGVSAQVTFAEQGITVEMLLQLEADGVRVEVPFASIREENPTFRLGKVYLYPFLGATRGSTIPGYMFLPDGSGSLVRFTDVSRADNMFYGRYYGLDMGILAILPYNELLVPAAPITVPVFGMAHEDTQSAFISVVEKGAAYGEVQMHPSGIITNFNFLYNAFIYNETYFQATNRSGAGVTTLQRQPNAFDAVVHYRFLTGDDANYVGMARSYQQYLIENGQLRRNHVSNPNIGIRLEFLGGDKERVLFWNRFVSMTTIRQMSDILTGLDLPNADVIYYGWQPFGATSVPPTSLALEGSLGSVDDIRALINQIEAIGGYFSFYLDPQAALRDEPGYSPRTDLAMAITNIDLRGYKRYATHYFTFNALQNRFSALSADIANQVDAGLALDMTALYSDFRENHWLDREASREAYRALFTEAPVRLTFYRPNDYLFGAAAAYYDIPITNNGYIYTSESVPFLQIVLAGFVPYYGNALNFSSNQQDDLLRHVEYGVYPSYFLTHEATAIMLNTPSSWIYTSSYDQWGDDIRQTYAWMNNLLAPVRGQEIVAHGQLANRVFATTYANGRRMIVNYRETPFEIDGVIVEARNAALLETTP